MKKLFKERELFKGGNYMRKYGNPFCITNFRRIRHCWNFVADLDSTSLQSMAAGRSSKSAFWLGPS